MIEEEIKPFNFEEYQEYLQSDEFKKQQLKRLVDNHRLRKSLDLETSSILSTFSDPIKKAKLYKAVSQVWNGVLESDTGVRTIEDIVNISLDTEECVKFLYENKHSNYFPSDKVFDEYLEHPIQKKLTKTKHLGKRQAKKQKTPMQTISYVYSAKSNSDRDDKLISIEKSLAEAHYMISLLAVNQAGLSLQVDQNNQQLCDVIERVALVEEKIKNKRKLKLYALHTSDKKPTTQELAEELGISLRTVKYWLKELRQLGFID